MRPYLVQVWSLRYTLATKSPRLLYFRLKSKCVRTLDIDKFIFNSTGVSKLDTWIVILYLKILLFLRKLDTWIVILHLNILLFFSSKCCYFKSDYMLIVIQAPSIVLHFLKAITVERAEPYVWVGAWHHWRCIIHKCTHTWQCWWVQGTKCP